MNDIADKLQSIIKQLIEEYGNEYQLGIIAFNKNKAHFAASACQACMRDALISHAIRIGNVEHDFVADESKVH